MELPPVAGKRAGLRRRAGSEVARAPRRREPTVCAKQKERRDKERCVSARSRRCVKCVRLLCYRGCCSRFRSRMHTCRKTSLDRQSIDSTFGAKTLPTFAAIAARLRSSLLLLWLL